MPPLPTVFFDTNLLIDYFWAEYRIVQSKINKKNPNLQGRLNIAKQLFKKWENLDFIVYLNDWNIWEFREKLLSQYYQNKCISFGYQMPKEIHSAKKNVPKLTTNELDVIEDRVKWFKESLHEKYGRMFNLEKKFLNELSENQCGLIDSILFYQAVKNKCDFFITRDEEFISNILPICTAKNIKTTTINPKDFLKIFPIKKCKDCGGKILYQIRLDEDLSKYTKPPEKVKYVTEALCTSCKQTQLLKEKMIPFGGSH